MSGRSSALSSRRPARSGDRSSSSAGGEGVIVALVLAGPGGDLLFRGLSRSTIGAEGFHGRVRDGIGCIAPRHDHQAEQAPGIRWIRVSSQRNALLRCRAAQCALAHCRTYVSGVCRCVRRVSRAIALAIARPRQSLARLRGDQADRAISTGWHGHCWPYTSGLSTWWSATALGRDLVLRGASRLDAFSGYPVRT